jgi:hypothetical protein
MEKEERPSHRKGEKDTQSRDDTHLQGKTATGSQEEKRTTPGIQ